MANGSEREGKPVKNRTSVERASDREVVVTRRFEAPVWRVFEAWTDPELFRRWWIPRSMGMTLLSCEMDIRTGGGYRLEIGHAGGQAAFFGRYLEVTPHSRIVWTNEENGEHGSVSTVTLEEAEGGTLLVLRERYATKEACDAAGTGAAEATVETFGQLDELLADPGAG